MTDKSDSQPTIEKLTSEGVSIRKCISYGEGGEYGKGGGSAQKAKAAAKPQGALSSMRMKGGGGY